MGVLVTLYYVGTVPQPNMDGQLTFYGSEIYCLSKINLESVKCGTKLHFRNFHVQNLNVTFVQELMFIYLMQIIIYT